MAGILSNSTGEYGYSRFERDAHHGDDRERIRTSDGKEHELDVIIFATGFDAVDGTTRV